MNGETNVSPEMALRLSKTLGRLPESWLAMQDQYNLWGQFFTGCPRMQNLKISLFILKDLRLAIWPKYLFSVNLFSSKIQNRAKFLLILKGLRLEN